MNPTNCINCNTLLEGPYCHSCGEKKVSEKDFSIKNILEQSLDVFTHLDSKLFATFKNLLFLPGLLSVNYVRGLRKPFMKPMQVFILSNIIFFIFLSEVDVFRIPADNFFYNTEISPNLRNIISQKMLHLHKSFKEIGLMYDLRSANIAKTFVFLFIPFLAVIFASLFARKRFKAGKHIIFATHVFSFVLLILVIWAEFASVLPVKNSDSKLIYVYPSLLIWAIYFFIAIRKFYNAKWWYAALSAALSIAALFCFIAAYREMISFYSLHTLH